MSSNIVLLCVLYCSFFTTVYTIKTTAKPKERMGPYTSVLRHMRKCDIPGIKYVDKPMGVLYVDMKNNVVKGNFTVLRDNSNIKAIVEHFYYIDGTWQPVFILKNISCRNKVVGALIDMLGVVYNKKTCAIPKGSYPFEVDYNIADHLWIAIREYGRMLRRVQVVQARAGLVLCHEFEADVVPKK